MTTRTLKLLPALALACAWGTAQSQTKWDLPTPYVDGEFHTQNIRTFADEVKKATGGQVDIVVHSGQSLIKHPDMLRAVSTGQVNIAEFLLGQFGNEDPVFAADNLPFIAVNWPYALHGNFEDARLTGDETPGEVGCGSRIPVGSGLAQASRDARDSGSQRRIRCRE